MSSVNSWDQSNALHGIGRLFDAQPSQVVTVDACCLLMDEAASEEPCLRRGLPCQCVTSLHCIANQRLRVAEDNEADSSHHTVGNIHFQL